MTAGSIAFSAGQARDRGMDPVGADHELSRHLPLPIVTILEAHTGDAAVVRANQIHELGFKSEGGTGLLRGIDQQAVDDGAPRGVETVNVRLRFDWHRDDLVAVVKRGRSHHRRAGRLDSLENAPARQLDNTGAHECVGRDRVAPVVTAVDRKHTETPSREEQRGGGAGATSSDNDDVEVNG